MKNKILYLLTLGIFYSVNLSYCIALLPTAAFAVDLNTAKVQGLVGEQDNGYLGAVQATAEVNALVNDVNNQRKAKYQEIANSNKTSLQSVEALAGQKAIDNTASGNLYRVGNSGWKKK